MARKGIDETKRQKKLARQKAARKQRLQSGGQTTPATTGVSASVLAGVASDVAAHFTPDLVEQPLAAVLIVEGWQEEHMASIIIARRLPDGRLAAGGFLVDLYGLGLKSAWAYLFQDEAHLRRKTSGMPYEEFDYAEARRLILAGVAWAERHKFRLPPEWKAIRHLIEPLQPGEALPMDLFGNEEGKPLLVLHLP